MGHADLHFMTDKSMSQGFHIMSNADADANADAVVTAIALAVLSYRRAKKGFQLAMVSLTFYISSTDTCINTVNHLYNVDISPKWFVTL